MLNTTKKKLQHDVTHTSIKSVFSYKRDKVTILYLRCKIKK